MTFARILIPLLAFGTLAPSLARAQCASTLERTRVVLERLETLATYEGQLPDDGHYAGDLAADYGQMRLALQGDVQLGAEHAMQTLVESGSEAWCEHHVGEAEAAADAGEAMLVEIARLLAPTLFPDGGPVLYLEGYVVPAELLDEAEYLTPLSSPPTAGPGDTVRTALAEAPDLRAAGRRITVADVVLRDPIVAYGPSESLGGGVRSHGDLAVLSGAVVRFRDAELLGSALFWSPAANPAFRATALAEGSLQRQRRTFGDDGGPIPIATDICPCGNLIECMAVSALSPSTVAPRFANATFCPPAYRDSPLERSWTYHPLVGIGGAPDDGPGGVTPFGGGEGGPGEPCGGDLPFPDAPGGGGIGEMCPDVCSLDECVEPNPEAPDVTGGEITLPQAMVEECGEIATPGKLIDDVPNCPPDAPDCYGGSPSFETLYGRWRGTSGDLIEGTLMPPWCLAAMHGGAMPEECLSSAEVRTSDWSLACGEGNPLCEGQEVCTYDAAGEARCFRCDLDGHCSEWTESGGAADGSSGSGGDAGAGEVDGGAGEVDGGTSGSDGGMDGGTEDPDGGTPEPSCNCGTLNGECMPCTAVSCRCGATADATACIECPLTELAENAGDLLWTATFIEGHAAGVALGRGNEPEVARRQGVSSLLAGASSGAAAGTGGRGSTGGSGKRSGGGSSPRPGPGDPPDPDPEGSDDGSWEDILPDFPDPEDPGSYDPGTPAERGDPVQLLRGDHVYRADDLDGPRDAHLPVRLTRTYRSQAPSTSRLGRNWTHVFEERLEIVDQDTGDGTLPFYCYATLPETSCVYHERGDGGGDVYYLDRARPAGTFVPEAGATGIVRIAWADPEDPATKRYLHRDGRGLVTEFDVHGRVLRKVDPAGNAVRYLYDADGQLQRVLDDRGHGLRFEYGLFGLLRAVEDVVAGSAAPRRVEYCYDLAIAPNVPGLTVDEVLASVNARDAEGRPLTRAALEADCFHVTEAAPTLEEVVALYDCGARPGGDYDPTCYLDRIGQMANHNLGTRSLGIQPPVHDRFGLPGPFRVGTDEVLRSTAFLREARALAAGTAVEAGCVPEDARVFRYEYSRVAESLDVQVAMLQSGRARLVEQPEQPCDIEQEIYRAVRGLEDAWGKLTRVERRLSPSELADGQPRVPSSALHCGVDACGDHWMTVLETTYGWDPEGDDWGHVLAQRYGSDVDPARPASCHGPASPPPGEDGFATTLPEFRFAYHDPDGNGTYPTLPPGVGAQLQQLGDAPHVNFAHPASTACAGLGAPSWWTDTLLEEPGRLSEAMRARRASREQTARQYCRVVETVDRAGVRRFDAVNVMGRPVVSLVETADGWFGVASRYNVDGRLVERQVRPDLGGPVERYDYDDDATNPLSRGNLLRAARVPRGGASVPAAFDVPLATAGELVERRWEYEPLANRLLRRLDARGGETRWVHEYQESAPALAAAAAHLARFGLSAEEAARVARWDGGAAEILETTVPVFGADANGDGRTGSARPLPVLVLAPSHDAMDGPARRFAAFTWDGYGALTGTLDAAGEWTTYAHAPRFDSGSDRGGVRCAAGELGCPSALAPLPAPPRDDTAAGGPVRTVTTTSAFEDAALAFGLPSKDVTATVRFERDPQTGRVQRVLHARSGAVTVLGWDGHGRLQTRVDPDGALTRWAYDGNDRPVARTVMTTDGWLEGARSFRAPQGSVVGGCQALTAGACDAPLHDLDAARAAGDDRLLLETLVLDGEERPALRVSPERNAISWVHGPLGHVAVERVFAEADPSVVHRTVERVTDAFGRVVREAVVGDGEALVTHFAWDALGRRVGWRGPDGVTEVSTRDAAGALATRTTYGSDGEVWQELKVERDGAGLAARIRRSHLADPDDAARPMTTVETRLFRDDAARARCRHRGDGAELWTRFASDGTLEHQRLANRVTGAPCTDGEETLLERFAHVDRAGGLVRLREVHAGGAWSVDRTLHTDWAERVVRRVVDRDGETATTDHGYDALGRLVETRDAHGTLETLAWDAASRPIERRRSSARGGAASDLVTTWAHDRDGRPVALRDPAGFTTAQSYDPLGRPRLQVRAGAEGRPRSIDRRYDALGRLRTVISGGQVWTRDYVNGTARPRAASTPTAELAFDHDPLGGLRTAVRREDVDGRWVEVVTRQTRDGRGALLREETRVGPSSAAGATGHLVELGRDEVGRLAAITATDLAGQWPQLETHRAHRGTLLDAIEGRVVQPRGTGAPTFRATYGYQGATRTSETMRYHAEDVADPEAAELFVERQLDGAGRPITQRTTGSRGPVHRHDRWYGRDDAILAEIGRFSSDGRAYDLGPGRVARYDGRGRLAATREAWLEGAAALDGWQSWLDAAGHAAMLQDPGVDAAALTVGLGGAWHGLARSALGTPLEERIDGAVAWAAEPVAGSPALDVIRPGRGVGSVPLGWDGLGRQIGAGARQIGYAGDDRPLVVHGPLGRRREVRIHDAFGRAVRVERDGVAMDRVWVGGRLLREVTGCGSRAHWSHPGPDAPAVYRLDWSPRCREADIGRGRLAEELAPFDLSPGSYREHEPALVSGAGARFASVSDLHGNVVGTVDAHGQLREVVAYDPHGARVLRAPDGRERCRSSFERACGSTLGQIRGYGGAALSTVSGLYDLRARQYDPHLRGFTSEDPLGYVDGYDLWQWVGGEPLGRRDPWGTEAVEERRSRDTGRQFGEAAQDAALRTFLDNAPEVLERHRTVIEFVDHKPYAYYQRVGAEWSGRDYTGFEASGFLVNLYGGSHSLTATSDPEGGLNGTGGTSFLLGQAGAGVDVTMFSGWGDRSHSSASYGVAVNLGFWTLGLNAGSNHIDFEFGAALSAGSPVTFAYTPAETVSATDELTGLVSEPPPTMTPPHDEVHREAPVALP